MVFIEVFRSRGAALLALAAIIACLGAFSLPKGTSAAGGVFVGNLTVTEGDNGTLVAAVPLSWSLPGGSLAIARINVTPLAPANANDIVPLAVTRAVSGAGSSVVNVTVVGDLDREPGQEALVSLTFDGLIDGSDTATLTVLDNDHPTLTIFDFQGPEDMFVVHEMRLSKAINQATTVRVRTLAGTGLPGVHFSPVDRLVTFPANTTQQFVTVNGIGDNLIELVSARTYSLIVNAVIAGDLAVGGDLLAAGRFLDDDMGTNSPKNAIIQIAIDPVPSGPGLNAACRSSFLVPEAFGPPLDVPFRLVTDTISSNPYEVAIFTEESTADAGQDYQSLNTVVVMPAGARTLTFNLRILDDAETEGGERFRVRGTGPMIADTQVCLQNQLEAVSDVEIAANLF